MKEIKEEHTKSVSRRQLLQSVAAAAVAVSVGPLALAKTTLSTSEASTPVPAKDDNTLYPVLVLWLAMTTNKDFLTMSDSDIAAAIGATASDVSSVRTYLNDASRVQRYQTQRDEFQYVSHTLLAYGGPQCPAQPQTLKPISLCKVP
jgi:hypothetical protein